MRPCLPCRLIVLVVTLGCVTGIAAAPATNPADSTPAPAHDPGTPTLDLLLPDAEKFPGLRPAVVIVHGGGWARGDKADQREKLTASALTERGYAAISINYALFTYRDGPWKGPQTYDAWPRNIHDVIAVLAWVKRKGPDHRIDPRRVAILGYSAGAHLALLAAYGRDHELLRGRIRPDQLPTLKAVISAYGTHDLNQFGAHVFARGNAAEKAARLTLASPVTHLRADSLPTLVIHGDADPTIPHSVGQDLAAQLAAKNVPHEFVTVPGGRHGFALGTPLAGPANDALWQFLKTHLD